MTCDEQKAITSKAGQQRCHTLEQRCACQVQSDAKNVLIVAGEGSAVYLFEGGGPAGALHLTRDMLPGDCLTVQLTSLDELVHCTLGGGVEVPHDHAQGIAVAFAHNVIHDIQQRPQLGDLRGDMQLVDCHGFTIQQLKQVTLLQLLLPQLRLHLTLFVTAMHMVKTTPKLGGSLRNMMSWMVTHAVCRAQMTCQKFCTNALQ